jgi:GDP-L-fucose synthase|tara:strand:- start:6275 stop:7162 length:888 start_codon:yes stop_codon:yes gene_type:complete
MDIILVTGGSGMVGKHLKEILPDAIYVGSKDYDLRNWLEVEDLFEKYTPTHVIHLAAKVGGIQDNINKPAEYFDDNILINTHILKASYKHKVKKVIGILSTCIYPDKVDKYPMREEDLFLGPPTPTNFSYGYAKRCLAVQIDAYNTQYGTQWNYLIPCNLYSEYDNFEHGKKMHFVTALLKKIKNSKHELSLLGTGTPLRQFMYAGDLARVIKEVIDKDISESFNIACPENYSINELAVKALGSLGKKLYIKYNKPELDGQYRKDVSSDKMNKIIPQFSFTRYEEGIKKVYDKIS